MKEAKSLFLILNEATDIISNNSHLNQRFVKEEIFDLTTLHELGFSVVTGVLESSYPDAKDAYNALDAVANCVEQKKITTRINRGKILDIIDKNILRKKKNEFTRLPSRPHNTKSKSRKTPVSKGSNHELFGKKLILKSGSVNDIYSDLLKLFKEKDKRGYSGNFSMIIRMTLRLIVELASGENKKSDEYIKTHWTEAKKMLSKNEKTTLSTQQITDESIKRLLHIGAHGYTASSNIDQTVALSLIIGKILEISHAK